MGFLTDWLTDWLKGLLIEGIMGNLTGLFDTVNTRVGEIAVQVGTTPAAWNAGVFSLIRQLSETVILPVAGLVLTFVATYELIQLIIEKNNLHDLDYWIFFKWIFKTAAAILILSNTFNIVMAVFDVSQSVIASAAGIVQGSTDISSSMIDTLEASLETMSLGALLGLWLQSFLIHVTMWALNIVIFVIVYGRMIEIYRASSDNILFYCVQGKGYYTLDGHTFTLNPNQYVIVPATDKPLVYWSDTEDPWSIYWVHFTSDALQAFNRAYHIVPEQGPQYIPHNEKGIRIWEEMYENLSRGYSPENLMNTNLCLYHLIATFVFSQQQNQNSSSPEKAIIRETIDYMKNNLDKTIRIEDFADLNKYSVSHFSKLFRLTTGTGFRQTLRL